MEYLSTFLDLFLHLDKHLDEVVRNYGIWTYCLLFIILFCETGLVVMPLLPGDSLLFAAGAIAARGSLDVKLLIVMLIVAAVVGDAVNYTVGHFLGPKMLKEHSRFLKKEYLDRTNRFYAKYGGKTIIFARFAPIVRTFAPFLAGVGTMSYARFAIFNITGAVLWVCSFILAGYIFGDIPIVQKNFTLVILAIIAISLMPAGLEYVRARREARAG